MLASMLLTEDLVNLFIKYKKGFLWPSVNFRIVTCVLAQEIYNILSQSQPLCRIYTTNKTINQSYKHCTGYRVIE